MQNLTAKVAGAVRTVTNAEAEVIDFVQEFKTYAVFVSHPSEAEDIAHEIHDAAEAVGIDAWLHEENTDLGTPLRKTIQGEIDNADALVVLLTEDSEASTYVQQEVGYAEGTETPVLPMLHDSFDRNKLGMLEGREWIPFTDDDLEEAVDELKQHLAERFRNSVQTMIRSIGVVGVIILWSYFSNDKGADEP